LEDETGSLEHRAIGAPPSLKVMVPEGEPPPDVTAENSVTV
jgi:hypothetical protein